MFKIKLEDTPIQANICWI